MRVTEEAFDDAAAAAAAVTATLMLFIDDESGELEPLRNVTDDVSDDVFATSLHSNVKQQQRRVQLDRIKNTQTSLGRLGRRQSLLHVPSYFTNTQDIPSAIAEGPRDALCQLKSCQLLHKCMKNHI